MTISSQTVLKRRNTPSPQGVLASPKGCAPKPRSLRANSLHFPLYEKRKRRPSHTYPHTGTAKNGIGEK
jgi:hypothetical protein